MSIFQWADDTLIIKPVQCYQDFLESQEDLNSFETYCSQKCLKLNENKTKHLRVSLKKLKQNILTENYIIKGQNIEKVKSHKHLGLTYDIKMWYKVKLRNSQSYCSVATRKNAC